MVELLTSLRQQKLSSITICVFALILSTIYNITNARILLPEEDTARDLIIRSFFCPEVDRSQLGYYRYHLVSSECYLVGSRGPCGSNMRFEKDRYTRALGKCVCVAPKESLTNSNNNRQTQRPLIHHPQTNNCYFAFTQGYCRVNEWLVVDDEGVGRCETNPCLIEDNDLSNDIEQDVNSDLESNNPTENYGPQMTKTELVLFNGNCVELGAESALCETKAQVISFINQRVACVNSTQFNEEDINN